MVAPEENSQIAEHLKEIANQLKAHNEQMSAQNELLLKIAQYYEREMKVPRLLPR